MLIGGRELISSLPLSQGHVLNSVSLSRRALMDDFDMTIEHEPLCEEIEREESVNISDEAE